MFSAINTLILTSVFGGIAIYKILRKVHAILRHTRGATSVEDPQGSTSHVTARLGGPRDYEDMGRAEGTRMVREIELEQNQAYRSSRN